MKIVEVKAKMILLGREGNDSSITLFEKSVLGEIAEPLVKKVVDLFADKKYKDAAKLSKDFLDGDELKEEIEGFLEVNELSGIDHFGTECNYHPDFDYNQLSCYIEEDGSGFHVDYDLTTDGELNDLTLQMDIVFTKKNTAEIQKIECNII